MGELDAATVLAQAWPGDCTCSPGCLDHSASSFRDWCGARRVAIATCTTSPRAIGVAAEHRAFWPDEFDRLPVPFATVAAELIRDYLWGFWWE